MMSKRNVAFLLTGLSVLVVPVAANADVISKAVGLFNIFVGLMLTASILTYATGLIVWSTRLGSWPSYRTEAVKIMEWSVSMLFVLVVLLTIVQLLQNNAEKARYALSVIAIVIVIGIGMVLFAKSESGPPAEKHEEPAP